MQFIEGKPKSINPGIYFVRYVEPEIGCYYITYKSLFWDGYRWRLNHPSDKVSHYCVIKEPRPLNKTEYFSDILGRMECVVQSQVLPNLSTPPGKE